MGGGGRGSRKSVCLRTRGEGVLLGQVRTHAKKKFALFQVFERPQISDITQKHDKNNIFHDEYFLFAPAGERSEPRRHSLMVPDEKDSV